MPAIAPLVFTGAADPNVNVNVVLAAGLDEVAFIPLDAVGAGDEVGIDAPHVHENGEGWPEGTADVLDVPFEYDTETATRQKRMSDSCLHRG